MRIFFDLLDTEGVLLFRSFHDEDNDGIPTMEPGAYISKATIPANLLAPISYEIRVYGTVFNKRMCVPERGLSIPLKVEATSTANRAYIGDPIRGKLTLHIDWVTSSEQRT
jgi:lipopolysaccharide transport system ATP-binding protein